MTFEARWIRSTASHLGALRTTLRARADELIRRARSDAGARFRLSGRLRDRVDASVALEGDAERADEVRLFLFQGRAAIARVGSTEPFGIAGGDDVELQEVWSWTASVPAGRHLVQPWLQAISSPGPDVDAFLASHLGETLARALRKARRRGLVVERSHEERDVDAFFHEHLLPTLEQRHGEGAVRPTLAYLKSWNGRTTRLEIDFVVQDGRRVAAAAVVQDPARRTLSILASGTLPHVLEDRALRQETKALLYEDVFLRAGGAGFEVDLGLTRPFADDGVLAYKRRWGCRLQPAPLVTKLALSISPARRDEILAAAPLLGIDGGRVRPIAPAALDLDGGRTDGADRSAPIDEAR